MYSLLYRHQLQLQNLLKINWSSARIGNFSNLQNSRQRDFHFTSRRKILMVGLPGHFFLCVSLQGGRAGNPHPDPKHRWLLWPVWRGEVCHPVRAGGLLHSRKWHLARQGWHHHWAQIPPQLLGPHHREVCARPLHPPGYCLTPLCVNVAHAHWPFWS